MYIEKKPLFTGSGVAIVTPFTKETVDLPTLGKLLDFQMKNGTDAIIVCGTTGEASTMSYRGGCGPSSSVDHVDGRSPGIAGTGSNSTENAWPCPGTRSGRGRRIAAGDALLQQGQPAGLIRHFQVIADGVDVPLILYDVPSRTGVTIAPETYAELAKHPNINGVKEAGAISPTFRRPGTCARRTSPSGPATMTRQRPSVCWAARASSP